MAVYLPKLASLAKTLYKPDLERRFHPIEISRGKP